MWAATRRFGILLGAAVIVSGASAVPLAAQGDSDRGRAMAEVFAGGAGAHELPNAARTVKPAAPPSAAEEQRMIEEIDMLSRARAEAETRREELLKAREAAERNETQAGAVPVDPIAEALRRTEEDRSLAEEARRIDAAYQEAEGRRKAAIAARDAETAAARAQEQAAAAKARDQQRQAEAAAVAAEAARQAEAMRAAQAARLDAQRQADEQRRQAEIAAREAEAQRQAADASRKAREEQQRLADERQKADEARQKSDEDARQASMEADREAEAERVSAALRRAREARFPRGETVPGVTAASNREAVDEPAPARDPAGLPPPIAYGTPMAGRDADGGARPPSQQPSPDRHATKVTVLLVMTPGDYGIRRHNKTADPLLCGETGCYVSAGASEASDLLRGRRALGVGRTLGSRAGACRNSLTCVFRDVELHAYPAIVQPIDMHVLRHDRRQPQVLHETSECRVVASKLACVQTIRGPDYAMWVVPERLAAQAGPALLERALEEGLPEAARLDPSDSYTASRNR